MLRRWSVKLCLTWWVACFVALLACGPTAARAQDDDDDKEKKDTVIRETVLGGTIISRPIGGVSVNVDGVINNVDPRSRKELADLRRRALDRIPTEMSATTELRMISLRQLDETLGQLIKQKKPVPDELRYLAGLQRVQYIFVDPDNRDIVIAGPAEGWKVNDQDAVVGVTTGRPVLRLEDLIVAMRTANEARNGGITCSIDPTEEGIARLHQYMSNKKTIGDPNTTLREFENVLGPQTISVTGVPGSSRFAHVLVAADYRMKRIAMKLEQSPVKGLPSFVDMAAPGGSNFPRWWLAPNYEALAKDPEGLAWEIRGIGVKCQTAEATFNQAGQRTNIAQANPVAEKWASLMTARYEELAARETVFAELRNCIDLAVVSALILKEDLCGRAGCELPALLNEERAPLSEYRVPKQVSSQASAVKKGRNWVITASGGVMIQPWEIIQTAQPSDQIASTRSKAVSSRKTSWWWN